MSNIWNCDIKLGLRDALLFYRTRPQSWCIILGNCEIKISIEIDSGLILGLYHLVIVVYKTYKNWLVFVVFDQKVLIRFCWLIGFWNNKFQILKNLKISYNTTKCAVNHKKFIAKPELGAAYPQLTWTQWLTTKNQAVKPILFH